MELRPERPGDRRGVRGVHLGAFEQQGPAVADLVDDLRRSVPAGHALSLVAEQVGRVVGHVMFTRGLLDARQRLVEVRILSPLAVLPDCQGQGIGSALVRAGLQSIAGRQSIAGQEVPVVFLEGAPGYYARFGFTAGGPQGFRKPSLRIPDAAFQTLRLPAWEPWMTGTLVYPQTFWDHDLVGLRDGDQRDGDQRQEG
jgi:putative acetyltransferase